MLFPEGKRRNRRVCGCVFICFCMCVCMRVIWVGGSLAQTRVLPVSMCQPISLFLHVTDTHVGTHQPKLLQLMAVPLRCPFCGVQAWVTRYGLGTVSLVT